MAREAGSRRNTRHSAEKWRRRPDLNRGWRFCRFRQVVDLVDWPCPLVPDDGRFSVVFGRYLSRIRLEFESASALVLPSARRPLRERWTPDPGGSRPQDLPATGPLALALAALGPGPIADRPQHSKQALVDLAIGRHANRLERTVGRLDRCGGPNLQELELLLGWLRHLQALWSAA